MMIRLFANLLLLAAFNLTGCVSPANKTEWPYEKFDRVVGYQFVNPRGIGSPFLDADSKGGIGLIKTLKRKEVVLNARQTQQLFEAIFSFDPPPTTGLACYDPHHIFIFYSGSHPVAAFEACFICNHFTYWPRPDVTDQVSYEKLAKLCLKIGLGTEEPPDQKEVTERYFREHPND